jgi:nucleolar MIF4G domain-containing protein 1
MMLRSGMWWLPAAGENLLENGMTGRQTSLKQSVLMDKQSDMEMSQLLQLAADQRMNTDARRAVFVAIMGSDDYVEAHEKLLRLPLKVYMRLFELM